MNMHASTPSPLREFPRGWFALCFSHELRPGQVRKARLAGQELIVWRTERGSAHVSGAYCPHMGAHFAYGGTVDGEHLKCPFHHFEFDGEGACVGVPYEGAPPRQARLDTVPTHEVNGVILAWFDPEGAAPTWRVPDIDLDGWTPWTHKTFDLDSHPQETTENSVDIGHLAVVHGYSNVRQLSKLTLEGPFLGVRYGMTRPAIPGFQPVTIDAEFDIHVHGLGFSFVDVELKSLAVRTRQLVLSTPVEQGKIELRIALSMYKLAGDAVPGLFGGVQRAVTRAASKAAFVAFAHDVQQDFDVWQHKVYVDPPALARGDGPVGPYRHWARQFYPEKVAS